MSLRDRRLYERCWSCGGTRRTRIAMNEETGREIPVGSDCRLCRDGYFEVGLTAGQLERAFDDRDRLLVLLAGVLEAPAGCGMTERIAKALEGRSAEIAEARRKAR